MKRPAVIILSAAHPMHRRVPNLKDPADTGGPELARSTQTLDPTF
jgi:hypothetical protein